MRALTLFLLVSLNLTAAQAQERQWTLDASEREAFLVFGVAQTDDVGFSFWCEIGKNKISVFAPVPHAKLNHDRRIPIDLKIDDENFHIFAKASKTQNTQEISIEAPVAVDGTVMKAAAKGQAITITALGQTAHYPLIDADVSGLLRVCSGEFNN